MIGVAPDVQLFERPEFLPKENAFQPKIHNMLDLVYDKARNSYGKSSTEQVLPRESAMPHRFAGEATLAGKLEAVRAALATGVVPKYRQVADEKPKPVEVVEEKPTLNVHLFCEVGDYASLDPSHIAKLLAVGSWRPKGGGNLEFTFHPFDRTVTQASLRCKEDRACEQKVNVDPRDSQALEKILSVYQHARKNKPVTSISMQTTETILLDNPTIDIEDQIKLIEGSESGSSIPMFVFLTTREYGAYQKTGVYKFGREGVFYFNPYNPYLEQMPVLLFGGKNVNDFSVVALRK